MLVGLQKFCQSDSISHTEPVNFVIYLKESCLKAFSINTYARAINSFLNWLHERSELSEKLRIQKLREEETIIRLFEDRELKALSLPINLKRSGRDGDMLCCAC